MELDGLDLGPGLEGFDLAGALGRLCALPELQALVAFGSRGRGDAASHSDLDLAVIAKEPQLSHLRPSCSSGPAAMRRWEWCRWAVIWWCKAAPMQRWFSQSRWHVMGDVAREGRVLYVAP